MERKDQDLKSSLVLDHLTSSLMMAFDPATTSFKLSLFFFIFYLSFLSLYIFFLFLVSYSFILSFCSISALSNLFGSLISPLSVLFTHSLNIARYLALPHYFPPSLHPVVAHAASFI
jgi:hypothetical protein